MAVTCYYWIVNFFAIARVLKEIDIHKDKQQNTRNIFGNKNTSKSYG